MERYKDMTLVGLCDYVRLLEHKVQSMSKDGILALLEALSVVSLSTEAKKLAVGEIGRCDSCSYCTSTSMLYQGEQIIADHEGVYFIANVEPPEIQTICCECLERCPSMKNMLVRKKLIVD